MKARGLVLAVSALVLLTIVQPASTARQDSTFNDPQGDAQGGAPDVTLTTVSNNGGQIHFRIVVANQPALNADSAVFLQLDTDRNSGTGAPDTLGSDFFFYVAPGGYQFGRWTGVNWDLNTPYSTVRVAYTGGVDVIVDRSELGNTSGFNFWVRGIQQAGASNFIDDAPNDGTYAYQMQSLSPAIASVNVTFVPYPQAGKTFRVRIVHATLTTGRNVQPTSIQCVAKVGGRAIRGSGRGRCTFRLPLSSRRKMFSVRVTAVYRGSRKTVGPFNARIK